MRTFLAGLILGFMLLIFGTYAYFRYGYAPVSASAAPMPFEKYLAKKALHAKLEAEMPKTVPIPLDEPNYLAGARIYRVHCAACHGLPGQPATPFAAAMFPKPPELFHGKGVTDDTPGESYWKVVNGIRLSGMPAFREILSNTEAWQVSIRVANADKLPPSVTSVLATPLPRVE
jgi:mono/diheme cytochrome c family protein